MKASENTFELNAVLAVTLDSSDNDGLIFVPKNYYFGLYSNYLEISDLSFS